MKTIFPFFRLPPAEEIRSLAPLREFEILLIICAIIFLALMLLGIGCSYYCLKRRNIKVVKRRPASTLGSEITKISEPISMFDGLKIPRYVCISVGLPKKQNQSRQKKLQYFMLHCCIRNCFKNCINFVLKSSSGFESRIL